MLNELSMKIKNISDRDSLSPHCECPIHYRRTTWDLCVAISEKLPTANLPTMHYILCLTTTTVNPSQRGGGGCKCGCGWSSLSCSQRGGVMIRLYPVINIGDAGLHSTLYLWVPKLPFVLQRIIHYWKCAIIKIIAHLHFILIFFICWLCVNFKIKLLRYEWISYGKWQKRGLAVQLEPIRLISFSFFVYTYLE